MSGARKKKAAPVTLLKGPLDDVPITLIGHPWAPIGMGEQMRSHIAALSALHLHHGVFDIFRYAARVDPAHDAIIGTREVDHVPGGIRIFHVNGDEVERVFEAFVARGNRLDEGVNIIVPAWELPSYPAEWAQQLRRFDQVWALSRFIQGSLAAAGIESALVGQSVEPLPGPLLPRRHFGIRESAFVLLNFFDLSSYASRKNPDAVLGMFERLRAANPYADIQLVLKAKEGERGAEAWAEQFLAAHGAGSRVLLLARPLDTLGVRSLISACDCFVSLHRAEGFGRGLGEAMALGRLALGTDWSGNVDFMTAQNALAVRHRLVGLREGDYPHWQGQSWAEPDLEHAAELVTPYLADPTRGRDVARRGQIEVLASHGNRAVGLRILDQLNRLIS
jgi:glycosyltransferase involved in cell wall biosynthesis